VTTRVFGPSYRIFRLIQGSYGQMPIETWLAVWQGVFYSFQDMGNAVSLASRPGADGRVHGGVNKTELAVSLIGLGATIGFTYYLVNVLLKKLDPTNEGKQKAEERVMTSSHDCGNCTVAT